VVAARSCRTIGGVLRLVHVRTCDRHARRGPVLHGDGRHSGRARQGTAGRLGLGGPQSIPECSIRTNRDPQGGNHARAESHHHGRGGAGAGSGRDRSRRGHRGRAGGQRRGDPRLLQHQRDQRLTRTGPPGRRQRLRERLDRYLLERDGADRTSRASGTSGTSRAFRSNRASRTSRACGTEGRYRSHRACRTGRTGRSRWTTRASRTTRTARAHDDTYAYPDTYANAYPDTYANAYPATYS
jgi:hypothetical protein